MSFDYGELLWGVSKLSVSCTFKPAVVKFEFDYTYCNKKQYLNHVTTKIDQNFDTFVFLKKN
jgi:hypothetical protein